MGHGYELGQQTDTRQPGSQSSVAPAGAGRALKGPFSPSVCPVNYCQTVVVRHNSRKAGTDGLVPPELTGAPPNGARACSGRGVGPRWVGGRRVH